ncbi:accessory Sec system glycosylation chaperone GtfB [Lactococcus lactis]|uniref:accessory Sec system glycosylation chaperone GtfB n=1 Tax=Lactococcus lactis TaxID=1358 RepID=UPI00111E7B48|nr:accessory Sec system glycosylation chaperone GtfB [Lactococcus lactis]MDG4969784.1 accessory Sec system glycosylation chaperone GtfB [Lactococcus lactis]MDG5103686.1 accessory Sec system glycosylation chaperone GtfB [Lactococcus lactis]TNU77508.1 accessory Sec system glycosylation chaperone GtfB [Lactococcus lactis subsp. lactis]
MINLFENYTHSEVLLEDSLNQAGYENPTVVLNDDGYLPVHVTSPIGFFTGMDSIKSSLGFSPKFFNEISVPYYWEIIGDGAVAEIFEGYKKKGVINYNTRYGDSRFVESVEWLNDEERLRSVDLYNQNGKCFGKRTYSDGELTLTSYFDDNHREVILINHIVGTIQVDYQNKNYIFTSFEDFVLFYFEVSQVEVNHIFYNSLGVPFFISNALKARTPNNNYNHTLFWQELSQVIPGNMKSILEDVKSPTKHIIVQDRAEYERIKHEVSLSTETKISYLGYLYRIKIRTLFDPSILIVTNSDQIAQIEELIELLPGYQFLISARTEMSQVLRNLNQYSNVQLYPQGTEKEIEGLIDRSSIYLDVNYGKEVGNILWKAFENNLLLLTFNETAHNKRVIDKKNCFDLSDVKSLSDKLNRILIDQTTYFEYLNEQQISVGQVSLEDYREVLQ